MLSSRTHPKRLASCNGYGSWLQLHSFTRGSQFSVVSLLLVVQTFRDRVGLETYGFGLETYDEKRFPQ